MAGVVNHSMIPSEFIILGNYLLKMPVGLGFRLNGGIFIVERPIFIP
jgi:hypothetical protein